jgi:hypothetical protein
MSGMKLGSAGAGVGASGGQQNEMAGTAKFSTDYD